MNLWDQLKELIAETDVPSALTELNETRLSPAEEKKYQEWKKIYAPNDSGEDYDLRGAFKEGFTPDPITGHWPDKYKKPNHPTFSVESIYAVGANKGKAGHWDETGNFIPGISDEEKNASIGKGTDDGSLDFSPTVLPPELMSPEQLIEYHTRRETKPIRDRDDADLAAIAADPGHPNSGNARNELAMRARWSKQTFMENLQDVDYLNRNADRLGRQFATSIPKIPGDVASIAGAVSAIPSAMGYETGKETAQDLLKTGDELREEVNKSFATEEPENWMESLANIGPGAGLQVMKGAKVGGGLLRKGLEVLTPVTVGGGRGAQAANIAAQFTADQVIREAISKDADNYKTVFENFSSDAQAEKSDENLDFKVGRTSDGADIRNSDALRFAGYLGLGTIGLLVAPTTIRTISKALQWPNNSNVMRYIDQRGLEAPSTLETNVKPRDVFAAHLADPAIPIYRSMERIGLDPTDLAYKVETNTSAQHQAKVASAMEDGFLSGLDFRYKSKVPINKVINEFSGLPEDQKKLVQEYARLKNISQAMRNGYAKPKVTMDGETQTSIRTKLAQIKRQFPQVDGFQEGLRQVNYGLADFAAGGKYAIIPKERAAYIKQHLPNYYSLVPDDYYFSNIHHGEITHVFKYSDSFRTGPHLGAFENMQDWAASVMRSRILNSVRGSIVDMFLSNPTGKRLFKHVPEKVWSKKPEWQKKTVTIYRNGKRERYVTNQVFADFLRLDPNFAKHAWALVPGRVFQWNTTGHGAFGFAWTRFLRDTHLVQVTTPKEYQHLGAYIGNRYIPIPGAAHLHAFGTMFETAFRQGQEGFVNAVQRDSSPAIHFLKQMYGDQYVKDWANDVHKSYERSVYHLIKRSGGFDTSYARHQVQSSKNVIEKYYEKLPNEVKAFGRIWGNLIDNVQNAGIYGVASRNVRRALSKSSGKIDPKELEKILADLKGITGDVTKTGRSLITERGTQRAFGLSPERRFGVSKSGIVGENKIVKGVLKTSAYGSHALRTTSPWFNAMVQSFRTVGKAYMKDPITFTTRLWMGIGLPQIASYAFTASLGKEYLDYMMEGRTEYEKATSMYIPLPGKPPDQGIQIPFPLELAPIAYSFMQSMDHALRGGGSSLPTVSKTILNTFFGLVTPPIATAGVALTTGYQLPSTFPGIGEDVYKPKANPYGALHDYMGRFGDNLETTLRALWGSNHATYIGFLNSLMEEGDIKAAMKEAYFQQKQRIPIVKTPKRTTAFTELNQDNVNHAAKVREFESLWRTWIHHPGLSTSQPAKAITGFASVSGVPEKPAGMVKEGTLDLSHRPFVDPQSVIQARVEKLDDGTYAVLPTVRDNMRTLLTKKKERFKRGKDEIKYLKNNNYGVFDSKENAELYLKALQSGEVNVESEGIEAAEGVIPGLPDSRPITNWVVKESLQDIHDRFRTDGFQFLTIAKQLSDATRAVQSLRYIDEGKIGMWKEAIASMPEGKTKEMLKGIDTSNRNEVVKLMNHYEERRLNVLREVKRVEEAANDSISKKISQLAGREVKINIFDLDPYGEPPVPEPLATPAQP